MDDEYEESRDLFNDDKRRGGAPPVTVTASQLPRRQDHHHVAAASPLRKGRRRCDDESSQLLLSNAMYRAYVARARAFDMSVAEDEEELRIRGAVMPLGGANGSMRGFVVGTADEREVGDGEREEEEEDATTGSLDAMREFMTRWDLNDFAVEHANDPDVVDSLSPGELTAIATLYLFLLARERCRHSLFTNGRCSRDGSSRKRHFHPSDSMVESMRRARAAVVAKGRESSETLCPLHGEATATTTTTTTTTTRYNCFARLSRNFAECQSAVEREFPETYIHSYDTNNLANALATYVAFKTPRERRKVPHRVAYSVCVALMSLVIYSRCDTEVVLFFLRYVTAIRFPGQFLKSALLLQGTSDSGKSEFVSEVLRSIYSSSLTGSISNATLRNGVRDEINTDLMSMMNSHVCQCDEPERLNSELFKLLVSRTQMKARLFHEQQPQYLTNLAKIVFTANDHISMRSDAGVITRLRYCVLTTHRFKPLHETSFDTGVAFGDRNSTPSVAYQFAARCFARNVDFVAFRLGMFLTVEHFGVGLCEYNDSFYLDSDLLSKREMSVRDGGNGDDDIETTANTLRRFRLMSRFGILRAAANEIANDDDDEAVTKGCGERNGEADDDDDDDRIFSSSMDDDGVTTTCDGRRRRDGDDVSTGGRVFATRDTSVLLAPIEINSLPEALHRDARNLHSLIDPYQLLLRSFKIERDASVATTEIAMVNFLRSFLDESKCNVASGSMRDVVNKMKERLKMDHPRAFDARENVFRLAFRPYQ